MRLRFTTTELTIDAHQHSGLRSNSGKTHALHDHGPLKVQTLTARRTICMTKLPELPAPLDTAPQTLQRHARRLILELNVLCPSGLQPMGCLSA